MKKALTGLKRTPLTSPETPYVLRLSMEGISACETSIARFASDG